LQVRKIVLVIFFAALAWTRIVVVGAAQEAPACVADCDGNGIVTVSELVAAVRIALRESPLASCKASDEDIDGGVSIEELIQAIRGALAGCPTPTRTPQENTQTPSLTPTIGSPTASSTPTLPVPEVLEFLESVGVGPSLVLGQGPKALDISPDGRHVYVITSITLPGVAGGLIVLQRDLSNGTIRLTQRVEGGGEAGEVLDGGTSVTVSLDGRFVYAGGRGGSYRRVVKTGNLSFEQEINDVIDISVLADSVSGTNGELFVATTTEFAVLRQGKSALELIDSEPSSLGAAQIAVSPDERNIYLASSPTHSLTVFERSETTGEISVVERFTDNSSGSPLLRISSVAVSPDGSHVYTGGRTPIGSIGVFERNSETGTLDHVGTLLDSDEDGVPQLVGIVSVVVSPDGRWVFALSVKGLFAFERDTGTGKLTFVGAHFGDRAGVPQFAIGRAVAISPEGSHAYVAVDGPAAVLVFRVSDDTVE
jgi:6-phosphogluconolactonase (cycloisomerase 2 family)